MVFGVLGREQTNFPSLKTSTSSVLEIKNCNQPEQSQDLLCGTVGKREYIMYIIYITFVKSISWEELSLDMLFTVRHNLLFLEDKYD